MNLVRSCILIFAVLLSVVAPSFTHAANLIQSDVCVYGGTSGGVIAAVTAARLGKSVSLLVFSNHVGGLSAGGLGVTDVGNQATISGLSKEFYLRVGQYYGSSNMVVWFEPHIAERVYLDMLAVAKVPVYTNQQLASTTMSNQVITQITTTDGTVYRAKEFIDTSYEGDLMASAGVTFTVGREGTNAYNESLAGIRTPTHTYSYDPYVIAGNSASGLLPFVQAGTAGTVGQGDSKVQTYNFRLCLTQNATNKVAITPPAGYTEAQYQLFARYLAARVATDGSVALNQIIDVQTIIPNGKTDINANGELSSDFLGYNFTYPTNDYAARAAVYQQHKDYISGMLYYFATSTNVPLSVRTNMQTWGLSKDEFQDNGNWPYTMYVREARRMVSDYVMTQGDAFQSRIASDPIALASYTLDSHPVARLAVSGLCMTEGSIGSSVPFPYGVSYRSIIPKVGECQNLFCSFAMSASHIGFASIRMEPVFMMTSEAAATAAAFCIDDSVPSQQLNYQKLAAGLNADGLLTQWGSGQSVSTNGIILYQGNTSGITVGGTWANGANAGGYNGTYWHDQASGKGTKFVKYTPTLPTNDVYDVFLWWVADPNRATNTPVIINHANGTTRVFVNQQLNGSQWVKVLTTNFNAGATSSVTISNIGTASGTYVIANAVRWLGKNSTASASNSTPTIVVVASDPVACEFGNNTGRFSLVNITTTNTTPLTVNYTITGTAVNGVDYATIAGGATIPANAVATNIYVTPLGTSLGTNFATVTLTLNSSTNYTLTNLNAATVTILDRPINSWLRTNFSLAQLSDTNFSGDAASPAHDSLPNLLKYALGISPFTAYTNVFKPVVSGNRLSLTATQSLAASDVGLTFDYSTNLVNWTNGSSVFQLSTNSIQGLSQTLLINAIAPINSATSGFIRVRANRL